MRDAEAVFAAQATAAYEAANPGGKPWTHLSSAEWGRWSRVALAVVSVPTNETDTIARLTAERDEWARKAQDWRHKYAELRYPGMTREVKALNADGVPEPQASDKHDSTGAMASAWFGTPGAGAAVERVFGKDRDGVLPSDGGQR